MNESGTLWFYFDGTNVQGPLSQNELRDLADSGIVTPDTQICRQGEENWNSFDSIGPIFNVEEPTGGSLSAEEANKFPRSFQKLKKTWILISAVFAMLAVGACLFFFNTEKGDAVPESDFAKAISGSARTKPEKIIVEKIIKAYDKLEIVFEGMRAYADLSQYPGGKFSNMDFDDAQRETSRLQSKINRALIAQEQTIEFLQQVSSEAGQWPESSELKSQLVTLSLVKQTDLETIEGAARVRSQLEKIADSFTASVPR